MDAMVETPLDGFARYAVYYAPPRDSALARWSAGWFAHDPEGAPPPPPPEVEGLPAPRETLVERPRRYGFHATLKAPFRLAEGATAEGLDAGLAALAARRPLVTAPRLRVTRDDGFVSLRTEGPAPALDALAAALVTELDGFRAPPTEAERAARGRLDAREAAHLERWGYPYVLDRFTFHMTLTGPLPEREAEAARGALARALEPMIAAPLILGEVALFGDPGGGRPFRLLRRHALSG